MCLLALRARVLVCMLCACLHPGCCPACDCYCCTGRAAEELKSGWDATSTLNPAQLARARDTATKLVLAGSMGQALKLLQITELLVTAAQGERQRS